MNPTNYVFDGSSIPANKRNSRPMPADPTRAVGEVEYNHAMNAIDDLRQVAKFILTTTTRVPLVHAPLIYDKDTPRIAGAAWVPFSAVAVPNAVPSAAFAATLSSPAGKTVFARLYNFTDSEIVATLSTTSPAPVALTTALTLGMAAGNIKNDGVPRLYEVHIWAQDPVDPGDVVMVYNSSFDVSFTV